MTDRLHGPDGNEPLEYRPFRADCGRIDGPERHELDRLLDQGMLRRMPGSVLVAARAPDTLGLRAEALALALAPPGGQRPSGPTAHAVVGYASAAWLHGGGPASEPIDLVIPPGSARPKRPGLRVHEHRLNPREVLAVGDLTATSPVRTAADIARTLSPSTVGAGLDLLAERCGVNVVDVLDQLERMPHGRGVVRARDLVHAWAAALASRAQACSSTGAVH